MLSDITVKLSWTCNAVLFRKPSSSSASQPSTGSSASQPSTSYMALDKSNDNLEEMDLTLEETAEEDFQDLPNMIRYLLWNKNLAEIF